MWEVEYTDEFGEWWQKLDEKKQISVAAYIELLEKLGPHLKFPYSSGINECEYRHIRELRVQHQGKPYRVLYAFDPRRIALLLLGGKKGSNRWYRQAVPMADQLYKEHLEILEKEGYEL